MGIQLSETTVRDMCAPYAPGLSVGAENKNVTGFRTWVEIGGGFHQET